MTAPIRTLAFFAFIIPALAWADWPQWRGPDGNGISNAKDLPVSWSDDSNIAWKVRLPSWSGSTPIVVGDRVFLMSPSVQVKQATSEATDVQAPPRRGPGNRGVGQGGPRQGRPGQGGPGQGRPRQGGGRGYQSAVDGPGGDELLLVEWQTKKSCESTK